MKIKKLLVSFLILLSVLCVTGISVMAGPPAPYQGENGQVYHREELDAWNEQLIAQNPNRVDQISISGSGSMYDTDAETYTANVQMIAGGVSSGVTWSVTGPARIDQNGRLTGTGGSGTAVITAKAKDPSISTRLVSADDGTSAFLYFVNYQTAQYSVNIVGKSNGQVQPSQQTVTGISLDKTKISFGHEPDGSWYPASLTLKANLSPAGVSGKTVNWYDDSPGIEVQSTGPNTCVVTPTDFTIAIPIITITAECDNQVATCQVVMISRYNNDLKIILNRSNETVAVGGSFSLDATVTSQVASPVSISWTSSAPQIASVDNNGNVKGLSNGIATITATAKVDKASGMAVTQSTAQSVSATCQVSVQGTTSHEVAVSSVSLSPKAIRMEKGEIKKLTETVSPHNATNRTVTWGSSESNVVSVDSSGNITAQGPGEAIVTATASNGKCDHTIVEVKKSDFVAAPTKVALSINNKNLTVGESVIITANVEPAGTVQAVEWSSSNKDVAIVNQGKVTAHKPGTATITAKTPTGVSDKCTITVTMPKEEVKRVSGVSLDTTTKTLKEGDSFILKDKITPADATDQSVKWESTKPEVATVHAGKVTAISKGTTQIKVTTDDGNKTAQCTVTVEELKQSKKVSVSGVKLNQKSASLQVGDSLPLNQTITPADATDKAVKWFSSNDQVAKVSSDGVVVAVGAGSATISVVTEDGQKTAECSVSVKAIPEDTKHQQSSPGIVQPAPSVPSGPSAPSTPSNPSQDNPGTDQPQQPENPGTVQPNPEQPGNTNPGASDQPGQPSQPAQSGKIYRLYNEANHEHLYTTDANEAQSLVSSGAWKDESDNGWISPQTGEPVYRLYNEVVREHLYTKDLNEVNSLKNSGWTVDNGEQPLFYSGGDKPIYRVYNEALQRHHLTTDENEYKSLVAGGWNDEHVAFDAIG